MTMDKLFDGSDAHLLGANAELIQRLNEPELHYPGNFDTPRRANAILMCLCQEAADALEAADKRMAMLEEAAAFNFEQYQDAAFLLCEANQRIAELEAEVKHYMNSFDLAYNQAMKNGQAAGEAECKLAVAREALLYVNGRVGFSTLEAAEAWNDNVEKALAQIGGGE